MDVMNDESLRDVYNYYLQRSDMVYGWFKLLILIDVVVWVQNLIVNVFICDVCKLFMKTMDMLECPPQPLTLHKTIVWYWDNYAIKSLSDSSVDYASSC